MREFEQFSLGKSLFDINRAIGTFLKEFSESALDAEIESNLL
jgi:hypothetical protein